MNRKRILIILSIFGFLVLSIFLLNVYIKNRIETRINNFSKSGIEYKELDIGFLGNSVEILDLEYTAQQKEISAGKLSINDISLFKYLLNNKLVIDEILIYNPRITWKGNFQNESGEQGKFSKEDITIKQLKIFDGTIIKKDPESERSKLYLSLPEFTVLDISVNSSTFQEYIPFNYKSYTIEGDSVQLKFNPEHNLTAGNFYVKNGKVDIKDFKIIPIYNRAEFDKIVPYEKDRINLQVDSISLQELSFEFRNDTLYLENPHMKISDAELFIYRNKVLPDDPRKKTLYNEKFRELPVKLDFKKINITSSQIEYEVATERDGGPAKIKFNNIKGTIKNLTNVQQKENDGPRVKITASSLFMNETPVDIEWDFDVFNMNNKFLFSGEVGRLPGSAINPYMVPAQGIEAEGALNSVYFTFTGNEERAIGDVRVNYENFKINLLKEGSREEKDIISAIANLFLDNDGHSGNNVQKNIEVERDEKKSFWFYVWTGVRKGIMESVKQF